MMFNATFNNISVILWRSLTTTHVVHTEIDYVNTFRMLTSSFINCIELCESPGVLAAVEGAVTISSGMASNNG